MIATRYSDSSVAISYGFASLARAVPFKARQLMDDDTMNKNSLVATSKTRSIFTIWLRSLEVFPYFSYAGRHIGSGVPQAV